MIEAVLAGVLVAVVGAVLVRGRFLRVVAREFETALVYRRGTLLDSVRGGSRLVLRSGTETVLVDGRRRILIVSGQEIVAADGVTVRLTAAAEFEVSDARLAVESVESYEASLHLAVQIALREEVASLTLDELLAGRDDLGNALRERVVESAHRVGVEVMRVEVRDVMPPGEVRRALAEPALAAKEAAAALERARGETAALRSLANAARMVERHPGLLELRTLQTLADSPGTSTVLLPAEHSALGVRGERAAKSGSEPPPEAETP